MLAISFPLVMRLVLLNQSKLNQVFQRYQASHALRLHCLVLFVPKSLAVGGTIGSDKALSELAIPWGT